MYILKWSIDAWLYKVCVDLYSFAADIYTLMIDVAGTKIMDDEVVSTYAGNIGVLVGVFMLFKVAISLLNYLVNPDDMDDKRVGTSSLITGIVITMAMLLTYQIAFKALRVVQDAILNPKDGNNIIIQLFSGSGSKEPGEHINGLNCYYSNGKHPLISSFYNTDSFDVMISLANNNRYNRFLYTDNVSILGTMSTDKTKVNGITVDRKGSYLIRYNNYKSQQSKRVLRMFDRFRIVYSTKNSDAITINPEPDKAVLNRCPKYLFIYEFGFQNSIVITDDISQGHMGPNEREATLDEAKTTKKSYVNDSGRIMAGSLLFSFVDCDPSKDTDGNCTKLAEAMEINDMEGTYDYIKDSDSSDMNDAVDFQGFLALIFGIVLILFLVTSVADVAVRAVKLIVLEIFAPIPIILYSDPKTRNTFESWLKTTGTVYADVFIRILIIAVANFLVSSITMRASTFVKLVMIIGILLFIKEAPQFICNMLGIKAEGLGNFTLNPMDKLKQVPVLGSAVNAAGNAATQGWATLRSGQGIGKALKSAWGGIGDGWRKNGGVMSTGKEVAPGFLARNAQATKREKKAFADKNVQDSRDYALFTMADQLNKQSHTDDEYSAMIAGKKGAGYKASPQRGHTVHDHLEHIEANTLADAAGDAAGGAAGGGVNPGQIFQNWDDVGE